MDKARQDQNGFRLWFWVGENSNDTTRPTGTGYLQHRIDDRLSNENFFRFIRPQQLNDSGGAGARRVINAAGSPRQGSQQYLDQ